MSHDPHPIRPPGPSQPSGPSRPLQPTGSAQPLRQTPTAATRHMSAGAYLDEDFARVCLDEVYHQPHRAVAPSFGFDLGVVLAHCRRARRITLIRDGVIVGGLVVAACVAGPGVLVGLGLLAGWYGLVAGWRLVSDTLRRLGAGERIALGRVVRDVLASLVGLIGFFLGLSVLAPVLGMLATEAVFGGTDAGSVVTLFGFGAVLTMIVALGAPPVAAYFRWRYAMQNAPGGRPDLPDPDSRILEVQQQQLGNTTVYSGYSPFIGSGVLLDTERMALRLIRAPQGLDDQTDEGAREYTTLPFTNEELVRYVGAQLGGLTTATDPEHRLPGLRVNDRIFAAGNEALWTEVWTDQATIQRVIKEPADARRHYLACQVESWHGELVTSVYVHFVLVGRSLYLEIATCGLAPCRDAYRLVDDPRSHVPMAYLRAVWSGMTHAPGIVATAPVNLIRALVQTIGRSATQNRRLPRGFDYGARTSARELASPDELRNDFQTQDVVKYKTVITRRVVAATLDFLVAKGVDVAEFRQRVNFLINSGVYVGGNVGANSLNNSLNDSFNKGK